jgi:hypothetical protein
MAGTNIVFPECLVCLQPLQSDLVTPVNCGHVFHEDCLRDWHNKGNNDNCPICKRDSSHSIKLIYEIKYCSEDEIKEEPKTLTELLMRNRSLKSRNELMEKEIKELTEYNNKCQKTVEDFIKQVEENTKNMAKYKNEYLTLKYLLDEEKEKNQKNLEIIDKLKEEKNDLENFKNRFELRDEINKETDNIFLNKDKDKIQEDLDIQFYKLLNDDDEKKGLREYFYVLQQKIQKLTTQNEELAKEKKDLLAKEKEKYNFGFNNSTPNFTQLLQLSTNVKKRNYNEYIQEYKNKDKDKNKLNSSEEKNNINNSSNNKEENNIKNKNDKSKEGIDIIMNDYSNNKRQINALRLKKTNNDNIGFEFKKLYQNPLKKKGELLFKNK